MFKRNLDEWKEYLISAEFWQSILNGTIKIAIIILGAFIIIKIGKKVIHHIFNKKRSSPLNIEEKRIKTINVLLNSVLTYTVYFVAIVMILETLTIKISALIAGAGVAGLAIGFGAQSLVKDVISGFFIIFEEQFSVGDYVNISGVTGTVVEIGLRTTKVRSWTGEQNVIPNGNITQVVNYSVNNGLSVVDINVPYEADVSELERKITVILNSLPHQYDFFINTPIVYGVERLNIDNYVIRVTGETKPVFHWAGERAIRKEIQDKLYKEGIYIPFEKFVIYSDENEKKFDHHE